MGSKIELSRFIPFRWFVNRIFDCPSGRLDDSRVEGTAWERGFRYVNQDEQFDFSFETSPQVLASG